MKRNIFILVLIILLKSCKSENKLTLVSDNSHGLINESPIFIDTSKVGKVSHITVNNSGEVFFDSFFDSTYKIPINSTFEVKTMDLLGTKSIVISKGNSTTYLNFHNDTVELVNQEKISEEVVEKIKNINQIIDTLEKIIN